MGPSTGTIGVADTGEQVDAALLVCLAEHWFWGIWEEHALFLDDFIEEMSVALDVLDVVLVKGELSRLGCRCSCLSSSSYLSCDWVEDCLDD